MIRPDEAEAALEFDRWAATGRAESMAKGHRHPTGVALDAWTLGAQATVLDVGCGNGWAVQWAVERGAGRGVGVDISPAMIERARQAVGTDERFRFEVGSGQVLPLQTASVSHLLSVESLYYYPDPAKALEEWARVLAPGGRLAIVLDLYVENEGAHVWVDVLPIDVHLLSAETYCGLAREAGFASVSWRQVCDPRPIQPEADFEPSRYWPTYAMYRTYIEKGTLLVEAMR
jgi:SAM-dependent methyltransferase